MRPVDATCLQSDTCVFSFCTLVTDWAQYEVLLKSIEMQGFQGAECLYIDNSKGNKMDAFSAINHFLNVASGRFIVLVHQDVELLESAQTLSTRLTELQAIDGRWALAGNAGGVKLDELAVRITDPHGKDQRVGEFPQRVCSLDENFIIVRKARRIASSGDLSGFHLYGTDLCVVADVLGYTSYVIDYHVHHKGSGSVGNRAKPGEGGFYDVRQKLIAKYAKAFRPRYIQTTCTTMALAGGRMLSRLLGNKKVMKIIGRHNKSGR